MTPDDLIRWRQQHRYDRYGFSRLLGIDKSIVKRWERGTLPIPQPIAKLLTICTHQPAALYHLQWLSLEPRTDAPDITAVMSAAVQGTKVNSPTC